MDTRTGNPNARPGQDFTNRECRYENTRPVGGRPDVVLSSTRAPLSDSERLSRISRFRVASTESPRAFAAPSTAKAQAAADVLFRVGEKRPVVIIPEDVQGNTIHGLSIRWTSSNPAVLTIAPDGMAEAMSPGSATLTASAGSFAQSLQVVVDGLPNVPASAQVVGKGRQVRPAVFKRSHVAVRKAALQQNPQLPQWTEEEIQSFSPSYNPAGTQLSKAGGRAPISPTPPPANPDGAEPGGNENFTFAYPLAGLSGRGLNTGVSLFYNSRVWKRYDLSTAPPEVRFEPEQAGSLGTGFATGFGFGTTTSTVSGTTGSGSSVNYSIQPKFKFQMPDGSQMNFRAAFSGTISSTPGSVNVNVPMTLDGATGVKCTLSMWVFAYKSYPSNQLIISAGVNSATMLMAGGTTYTLDSLGKPTRITDQNGNYIDIAYGSYGVSTVKDTLGRFIRYYYNSDNLVSSITVPGYDNGADLTAVEFAYENLTVTGTFSITSTPPSGAIKVLRFVRFPGTGNGYEYQYSPYGMIYRTNKLAGMTSNGSGGFTGVEVARTTYNYPTAPANLGDVPIYSTRTDDWAGRTTSGPSVTTYAVTTGGTRTTTVTQPDGTIFETSQSVSIGNWNDGLVSTITHKQSNGTILSQQVSTWETYGSALSRIKNVKVRDDAGNWMQSVYTYSSPVNGDYYDNVTKVEVRELVDAGGAPCETCEGNLLRQVTTSYKNDPVQDAAYLTRGLWNLPKSVEVRNPANPTGPPLARTDYEYDGSTLKSYTPTVDMWSDPGATTVRGNLTKTIQYANMANLTDPDQRVERTAKYDSFGNLVEVGVACCQLKQFVYDYTYRYALPVQQKRGSTTDPLVSSAVYDFNTGLVKTSTDENGSVTTNSYSIANLRPTQTTLPNGHVSSVTFNDTPIEVPAGSGRYLASIETWTNRGDGNPIQSRQYVDGRGQVIRATAWQPDGWLTVEARYDNQGRVLQGSNPFRLANPTDNFTGFEWTTTAYDIIGRPTSLTTPDNAQSVIQYSNQITIVTDPKGRKRRSTVNALGQLKQIVEDPDNLNYVTNYNYDNLGNLIRIEQGAQNRYFSYDAMSRPVYARSPELDAPHTTTSDVSGNNAWSSKTIYSNKGLVYQAYDAKNTLATLYYDGMNRVVEITYSDGTPTKKFAYGDRAGDLANTPPTTGNFKGRTWKAETSSTDTTKRTLTETTGFDSVGRPLGVKQYYWDTTANAWGTPYTTSRTYNQTSITGESYPSGRTVSYGYDTADRWLSLSGNLGTGGTAVPYSDNALYDVWGGITRQRLAYNLSLGNTGIWVNERRNIRGQAYDKRAGKESWDWGWNRGCWQNYFSDLNETWGASGTDNAGQVTKTQTHLPEEYAGNNVNNAATRARMFRVAMEYDTLGRLKRSSEIGASYLTNGTWGETWTTSWAQGNKYDRYGNRTIDQNTSQTFNAPNSKKFAVEEATNRLLVPADETGTMTYDAMGQLIKDTYTRSGMGNGERSYDADGRLISAQVNSSNQTENAVYDAGGKRVLVKNADGTTSTRFVYGIDGEQVAEYASSNFAAGNPTVEYAYRSGEILVEARGAGNTWRITDSLGSVRTTLNANGDLVSRVDHMPFGEELGVGVSGRTGTTGTYPMFFGGTAPKQKYTGLERDTTTSYDHTLWRKMDSTQGRWTSPDPYQGSIRLNDPQSLNRYTYVGNDPGNFVDPLGLFGNCVLWGRVVYNKEKDEIEQVLEYWWVCEFNGGGNTLFPIQDLQPFAPLSPEDQANFEQSRGNAVKLLDKKDCADFLKKKGINIADLVTAIKLQTAFDANLSTATLLESGLYPAKKPDTYEGSQEDFDDEASYQVETFFDFYPGAQGVTAFYKNGVFLTDFKERTKVFYRGGSSVLSDPTSILHEALHSLTGLGDPELAKKIGSPLKKIGKNKYDTGDITKYLKSKGC